MIRHNYDLDLNKKKILQKKKIKKNFLRTDIRTDRRTTQNYSSEPHKKDDKII
jgi:hypothetical protein